MTLAASRQGSDETSRADIDHIDSVIAPRAVIQSGEAIHELQLPTFIHPDGARDLWFQDYALWNSIGQPIEEVKVLSSLISAGVAVSEAAGFRFDELLDAADHALYESKRAGRDRATVVSPVGSV